MMPNDYFQFKQFLVKQDKCAMKVCTDACLFGAWTAWKINDAQLKVDNILDIGCGTGLLSLMLAQKFPLAIFDAVEIDNDAAEQAKENFQNSPWKNQLNIYHDSIQNFSTQTNKKYDVIICNPPFYENDLKSDNTKRNLALHSNALLLEELVSVVENLLEKDGSFFCLLPFQRTNYFEDLLVANKFCLKEKTFVKQTSNHSYFRTMIHAGKNITHSNNSEITIINAANDYNKGFRDLLTGYYLHL